MNLKTKRIIKWIVKRLLIVTIFLFGLIVYGGYLMSIDDRYGDLQDLYWKSKDGDIIVNKLNSEVGIVEVDWHRIYVKKDSKLIELEDFLDAESKQKYKAVIYRLESKIENIKNLNIPKLAAQSVLIAEVSLEY